MEKLLYGSLLVTLLFTCSVKEVTLEDALRFEDEITYTDTPFQREVTLLMMKHRELSQFFNRMGFLESSNRYHVSAGSYHGKYQMGAMAMKDINMDIRPYRFLQSPALQEIAMINYTLKNREYLEKYIEKYANTKFDGLYVTEAGILASAHLGGNLSVRIYFDTNGHVEFKDGNGTSVRTYMEKFQDMRYFTLENQTELTIIRNLDI